jgi:dTDP-4-amino-4,6-dideoxygalactose transaminase
VQVRFAELGRATDASRDEIGEALERVLDSGWFLLGRETTSFEEEFARWNGSREAVAVANGTDAIELALRALDIGPGNEVVTQANTCVPTVAAIERAGAIPVLCDAERSTGTMDVESLEAALTAATRAVVPVHLYGQCADMPAITQLADQRGLAVIEDCAQAHGAEVGGYRAGTSGIAGCFSFYPTKNLGALGDAGAVVTDDPAVARQLRLVRQYGQEDRYNHVERGVNSRLDELQASVLRVKLERLEAGNRRRAAIAEHYDEALEGTAVAPLERHPDRKHVFHLYVVEVDDREAFRAALAAGGVETLIHYPRPIHGHPPYRELATRGQAHLTNAEQLADRVVSLPLYPELTDEEVEHVAATARAAASRAGTAR